MVHDSIRNLRLDKRLLRRRGWIRQEELSQELADLPDATASAEYVDPPSGAPASGGSGRETPGGEAP